MVVRHALGASRARVIAQIVTEGLVLALAAAVLGLVVAQTTVRYAWARASQIMGDGLPFWVDLTLEPATIAYALLLALVAAALIGLLPALKATGASVQRGLQGITSTGGTMKFGGIWSFIVGAQVACTLLFVPAAVGIYTNSRQEQSTWAAFPTERYLTFRLRMDNEALAGERGVPDDGQIGARRARAYEELAGRLREEPGVTHVTIADRQLGTQPDWVALEMEQDGAPPARLHGNYEGGFAMAAVGAGYHEAFGAAIVAGRGLQAADAGAPNRPVVVNEAFMREVGRNPVGARVRTIQRGSERELGPWHEIVGVVTDLEPPATAVGRRPLLAPRPRRSSIPSWSLCASRGTPRRLRHASPPLRGKSMWGCSSGTSSPSRRSSHSEQGSEVLGSVVFASILVGAVVFSAAGLYALMAVAVARRTREIGIRIALGANPRHVLGSVFARAGSSARRRHHRRQQPHPAPRVARRQPDRGSPRLVGDHVRHHGGGGRAGVRRTGAPGAACSTDRGAATGLTCSLRVDPNRSRVPVHHIRRHRGLTRGCLDSDTATYRTTWVARATCERQLAGKGRNSAQRGVFPLSGHDDRRSDSVPIRDQCGLLSPGFAGFARR